MDGRAGLGRRPEIFMVAVRIVTILCLCFLSPVAELARGTDLLPEGVPNPLGPDGRITSAITFTTKAYQMEALRRVIQEANDAAKEMKLPEKLPITETNIVKAFISPFGFARVKKAIGNITTANFIYYVSQDNKLSYVESANQEQDCRKYESTYTWPQSQMDTNQAFQLAQEWLEKASMDVEGLNRDFQVFIETEHSYVHPPAGKFVPVYYVYWAKQKQGAGSAASVRLFTPANALLQLRVEEPKYILRKPLVFTNLSVLLAQTNDIPRSHPEP